MNISIGSPSFLELLPSLIAVFLVSLVVITKVIITIIDRKVNGKQ